MNRYAVVLLLGACTTAPPAPRPKPQVTVPPVPEDAEPASHEDSVAPAPDPRPITSVEAARRAANMKEWEMRELLEALERVQQQRKNAPPANSANACAPSDPLCTP